MASFDAGSISARLTIDIADLEKSLNRATEKIGQFGGKIDSTLAKAGGKGMANLDKSLGNINKFATEFSKNFEKAGQAKDRFINNLQKLQASSDTTASKVEKAGQSIGKFEGFVKKAQTALEPFRQAFGLLSQEFNKAQGPVKFWGAVAGGFRASGALVETFAKKLDKVSKRWTDIGAGARKAAREQRRAARQTGQGAFGRTPSPKDQTQTPSFLSKIGDLFGKGGTAATAFGRAVGVAGRVLGVFGKILGPIGIALSLFGRVLSLGTGILNGAFKAALLALSAPLMAVNAAIGIFKASLLALISAKIGDQLFGMANDFQSVGIGFANVMAGIGGTGSRALGVLNTALKGTVDNLALMQTANQAVFLRVIQSQEQFDKLAVAARRLGRAVGRNAVDAFGDLAIGIGRQSRLILDNLGLIVQVGKATESYAAKVGKSADELTDAEKRQAFYLATMKAVERKLKILGEDIELNADKWGRMNAHIKNLALEILHSVNSAIIPIVDRVSAFVASVSPSLIGFFEGVATSARETVEEVLDILKYLGFGKVMNEGIDAIKWGEIGANLLEQVQAILTGAIRFIVRAFPTMLPILSGIMGELGKMLWNGFIGGVDAASEFSLKGVNKENRTGKDVFGANLPPENYEDWSLSRKVGSLFGLLGPNPAAGVSPDVMSPELLPYSRKQREALSKQHPSFFATKTDEETGEEILDLNKISAEYDAVVAGFQLKGKEAFDELAQHALKTLGEVAEDSSNVETVLRWFGDAVDKGALHAKRRVMEALTKTITGVDMSKTIKLPSVGTLIENVAGTTFMDESDREAYRQDAERLGMSMEDLRNMAEADFDVFFNEIRHQLGLTIGVMNDTVDGTNDLVTNFSNGMEELGLDGTTGSTAVMDSVRAMQSVVDEGTMNLSRLRGEVEAIMAKGASATHEDLQKIDGLNLAIERQQNAMREQIRITTLAIGQAIPENAEEGSKAIAHALIQGLNDGFAQGVKTTKEGMTRLSEAIAETRKKLKILDDEQFSKAIGAVTKKIKSLDQQEFKSLLKSTEGFEQALYRLSAADLLTGEQIDAFQAMWGGGQRKEAIDGLGQLGDLLKAAEKTSASLGGKFQRWVFWLKASKILAQQKKNTVAKQNIEYDKQIKLLERASRKVRGQIHAARESVMGTGQVRDLSALAELIDLRSQYNEKIKDGATFGVSILEAWRGVTVESKKAAYWTEVMSNFAERQTLKLDQQVVATAEMRREIANSTTNIGDFLGELDGIDAKVEGLTEVFSRLSAKTKADWEAVGFTLERVLQVAADNAKAIVEKAFQDVRNEVRRVADEAEFAAQDALAAIGLTDSEARMNADENKRRRQAAESAAKQVALERRNFGGWGPLSMSDAEWKRREGQLADEEYDKNLAPDVRRAEKSRILTTLRKKVRELDDALLKNKDVAAGWASSFAQGVALSRHELELELRAVKNSDLAIAEKAAELEKINQRFDAGLIQKWRKEIRIAGETFNDFVRDIKRGYADMAPGPYEGRLTQNSQELQGYRDELDKLRVDRSNALLTQGAGSVDVQGFDMRIAAKQDEIARLEAARDKELEFWKGTQFAAMVTDNVVGGLAQGFWEGKKTAENFADMLEVLSKQAWDSFVEYAADTLKQRIGEIFKDKEGLFGAIGGIGTMLLGIGGAIHSAIENRDNVTIEDFDTAVNSSEAVRGVVAGPTNIAVSKVGDQLKSALGTSEILLERIALAIESGGSLSGGVGGGGGFPDPTNLATSSQS